MIDVWGRDLCEIYFVRSSIAALHSFLRNQKNKTNEQNKNCIHPILNKGLSYDQSLWLQFIVSSMPCNWRHHLPADWDCGAIMTCDCIGTFSSVLWLAIWVRTEVATASAAERMFSPLGDAVTELCWMTGAGEPVGSELSLGLSDFSRQGKKKRVLVIVLGFTDFYRTCFSNYSASSHQLHFLKWVALFGHNILCTKIQL